MFIVDWSTFPHLGNATRASRSRRPRSRSRTGLLWEPLSIMCFPSAHTYCWNRPRIVLALRACTLQARFQPHLFAFSMQWKAVLTLYAALQPQCIPGSLTGRAAHKSLGSVRKKSRFTSDKLSVHFGQSLGSFPLRERLTLAGGAVRLPWWSFHFPL